MRNWRSINHLCCYVMLIWAYLPILGVYQSTLVFQVPFLGSLAIWILSGLALMSRQRRRMCLTFMCPFMFLMYFYIFIGYGNLNVPSSFGYVLLMGFIVNCIYYIERPDDRFGKRILYVSLLLITITAVTTLSVLMVDGMASRILTSSSSDPTLMLIYKGLNVGSFDFIYGLVVIIPMLVFYSFAQKKTIKSILIWCIVALFVFVIVKSNFTTALILLFVDFVFILLAGRKFNTNLSFFVTFSILLIIGAFLLTHFLNFMIQMSESLYSQNKLEGVLGVINGQESYDDTTSRSELLMMSILSFLRSPVWGVGAWYGGGAPYVGQHAQFVDDLARYGLLGAVPLMCFMFFGMKQIYNAFVEKHFYNRKVLASLILIFLLGFMNPIYSPGLLASVFIVVPFLNRYCYEKA